MAKISFTVSARTARLIGRENVASSKGAIIELVKNAYDADSVVSIVYFDNRYSVLNDELTTEQFSDIVAKGISEDDLEKVYTSSDDKYILKTELEEADLDQLRKKLNELNSLYIIDSGEGMTQKIIRQHWMTIGTDNKAYDVFTKSGRVKAGAKGIGRFALDKLGTKCEMITVFNPKNHDPDIDEKGNETSFTGYLWRVNWDDFEGEFKTIEKVEADLDGLTSGSLLEAIEPLDLDMDLKTIETKADFQYGTVLKISGLRDNWEDYYVTQVYSDLEVLVPPKESGEFQIFLYSSLQRDKYGEVFGSVCDDFDYKLTAHADENQNVTVKITRNEYDLELIDPDFFKLEEMGGYPYRKEDFQEGTWSKAVTFSKLLPGFKEVDQQKVFENIGVFDFSFYFMKRTYSSSDAERFNYKRALTNSRKDWLDKFGGVKLFRDNFRVRPYGEIKDSSFDWLGLGARKSSSPAGIAKEDGGWRVEPENVSGAIKISRLTNVNFEDKSSREGLQENKTFLVFKEILTKLIQLLEEDRAYIARAMDKYYGEKHADRINKEQAEKLARSILERNRKRKEQEQKDGETDDPKDDAQTDELTVLAELNRGKDEEIEKLKDEQKVLRGLASSGIVLASFSHDLSKLNNVLSSRVDKLKTLISEKIQESEYVDSEERKNPFVQLERMRKQDVKLQNWLNFSLGAARKDKRKRKQLFLHKYFNDLRNDWTTVMENRGIQFDTSEIAEIDMRVFEIDFDSIFNNLLVNSIDAFIQSKENRQREITIKARETSKEIVIEYHDNGPGLSKDIEKPEKIFEPLYTTKRNPHTGEEEGTGLGMWLVKSIAAENDAQVKLLYPEIGFGVRITFPVKYKRN
ncbi:MAG: HAMP domain-containing sensor histidine kinase [Flavobacteriales bacterium]